MAYAFMTEDEARSYVPTVVMVDGQNAVREVRCAEHHGQTH